VKVFISFDMEGVAGIVDNPSVISHVSLNGVRVGESGINALVALAHDVPVGLISGESPRSPRGCAAPSGPGCGR
jgi:D-aminopeptidase